MGTDLRLPTHKIVRPDKDHFLEEENPFEAMMSRFDRAAELLDLEPGIYKILRNPEKQIKISCPIVLDSGEVRTLSAGSMVVMAGANHAWQNRYDEPCIMATVVVGVTRDD